MDLYSNSKQRREEHRKDFWSFFWSVVFFLLALCAVALFTGCASSLDKHVNTCLAMDASPIYTKAEGIEKFECRRDGVLTTARR